MKKYAGFVLISVLFLATSCFTTADTRKTISVSGSGYVAVKADIVTFQIEVSEKAETTAQAQQNTNRKIGQILEILRKFNIEDKDITTTSLDFSTDYYWEDGKQIKNGETVSQTVYIKMRDLDSFAALVDELGSQINGISFYNVEFNLEDKTEASAKARELAYADAFDKAQSYASQAGVEIVSPISISDGYTSVSSRTSNTMGKMVYATAEAAVDYGTEAPSGTLTVSASTNVVFQVK